MARTVTDPPPMVMQHARPGVEISALPTDLEDFSGLARLAECSNSLSILHTGGALAVDNLDTSDNPLTSSSRDHAFRLAPPWGLDLPVGSAILDVWLFVVRGEASPGVTWTVRAVTNSETGATTEVNAGATTAGAWWRLGTIEIDDTEAVDVVTLEKISFDGDDALNRVEAVALLPSHAYSVAPAFDTAPRGVVYLDVALFAGERALSTFLLVYLAAVLADVAGRGGQAYCCSEDLLRGDGQITEAAVLLLDDVPTGTVEAEVVMLSSGSLGGSPLIRIVGNGVTYDQSPGSVGTHTETLAVAPGEENKFILSTRDINLRDVAVYYARTP